MCHWISSEYHSEICQISDVKCLQMSYVDAKSTEASSLPSVCRSRIYIHMLSLYLDSLSSTPKCPNGTLSSFLLSVFCLFLSFSSPSSHGWLVRDTSLPWVTACGCRNAQHPSLSPFVCVCVCSSSSQNLTQGLIFHTKEILTCMRVCVAGGWEGNGSSC